jgi:ABC-type molybdate transport system, periplasmic component
MHKVIRPTRRELLCSGSAGALLGLSGCLNPRGGSAAQVTAVEILAAGSLQYALMMGLVQQVDVPIEVETHGSATVARLVDSGRRDPDIVALADTALFETLLTPPWYVEFASNALVVVVNPSTDGGQHLLDTDSDRWYQPLLTDHTSLGRTDPELDPLGYRTLFMLSLAARYYDVPDLAERLLQREQIYPETTLLSQFETGAIDAAVAYRNMAIERNYEFISLPDEINLSHPNYITDWYAKTSYQLGNGLTIEGNLISYAATIRHTRDASIQVFDKLVSNDYLTNYGFLKREESPSITGEAPATVSAMFDDVVSDHSNHKSEKMAPVGMLHGTP